MGDVNSETDSIVRPDVIIIGGGLAGLSCARKLAEAGITYTLLEASDRIGGRVKTDIVDGFLLDRGFQVFLTAYQQASRILDDDTLSLRKFTPGALVFDGRRMHRLADPWRQPQHALGTLLAPVGNLLDKFRVARLRSRACRGSVPDLFARPDCASLWALRKQGFSEPMIARFFTPFLGGIFLDPTLHTSARMMEFVLRMFSQGDAVVPARGMEEIPQQIAAPLEPHTIWTNTKVQGIEDRAVRLGDGRRFEAQRIVLATEGPEASRLLGQPERPWRSVTCLYFAAEFSPVREPVLVLNGSGHGIVNNLAVMSDVAPTYAPRGQALISVTVLGIPESSSQELVTTIQRELESWFGSTVQQWRHLRTYTIRHALPVQDPPLTPQGPDTNSPHDWFLVAGDHREHASIEGAIVSGMRAADLVIASLRGSATR